MTAVLRGASGGADPALDEQALSTQEQMLGAGLHHGRYRPRVGIYMQGPQKEAR